MTATNKTAKESASRQNTKKRGRPLGSNDLDKPRKVANTVAFTELLMQTSLAQMGRELTAKEISEILEIGKIDEASGRRSVSTWKNMRRGTQPVSDERLLQLCRLAIDRKLLTVEQLQSVQYGLAIHAGASRGPKIVDLLIQRRQELTAFHAAKLAVFRALKKLDDFERKLKRSELVDNFLAEIPQEAITDCVNPIFLKFETKEVCERLSRLELRFFEPNPKKVRLMKSQKMDNQSQIADEVDINAFFDNLITELQSR